MIKLFKCVKPNQSESDCRNIKISESGNVFFAMFGAVVMVGAIGVAATSIMRGPMKTMAEVSQRAEAEAEIMSNMQLVALSVSEMTEQDCDLDGTVEPEPWTTGTGPTGGGLLPSTIRTSNSTDPWQTQYGYCVWDHGTTIDDAGCGGGTQNRLQGADPSSGGSPAIAKQTAYAVISAGPDRTFETTCRDFVDANTDGDPDLELVQRGGDDLVMTFNYGEASVATSSKWKLKEAETGAQGSGTTVELNEDVELTSPQVQIGESGQAKGKLEVGGLRLPHYPDDDAGTWTCISGGLNDKQMRINTDTDPDSLEICIDDAWTQIGGDVGSGNTTFDPRASNCTANNGGPFALVDSDTSTGAAIRVTSNGSNYVYVAHDSNGFAAYTFDGSTLTQQDTALTYINGIEAYDNIVFAVGDTSQTVRAYTFDGSSLTLLDSVTYSGGAIGYDIHYHDGNVYVGAQSDSFVIPWDGSSFGSATSLGQWSYEIYANDDYIFMASDPEINVFNASTLALIDSLTVAGGWGGESVWYDGTYIYAIVRDGSLVAYDFDGSTISTEIDDVSSSSGRGVWSDGVYVYMAEDTTGVKAFTFDGSSFSAAVDTYNTADQAYAVYGDGDYIYVADDNGGIYAFSGFECTDPSSSGGSGGSGGSGSGSVAEIPAGCYSAGDTCDDGSVFVGVHPSDSTLNLYTSATEEGFLDWGPDSGVTGSTSISDGLANHQNIVDNYTISDFAGFEACEDSTDHGQSDWYLPAPDEWSVVYDAYSSMDAGIQSTFKTAVSEYYLTSRETNSTQFYWYRMNDDSTGYQGKNSGRYTRCIRQVSNTNDYTTGLMGHWKLDETSGSAGATIADETGNYDMIWAGDAINSIAGQDGTALNFNGGNQYAEIASFDPPHQGTVAFWLNADAASGTKRTVGSSDGYEARFNSDSNKIHNEFFETGSGAVSSTTVFTDGEWYHVALVYDYSDGTQKVYVNGSLEATDTGAVDDPGGPSAFAIGRRSDSATAYWQGDLDDVRIYDRVLTDAQVQELYACTGGTGTCGGVEAGSGSESSLAACTDYTPNSVEFDGTNDYLEYGSALSSVTDGTKVTGSFWIKHLTTGTYDVIMQGDDDGFSVAVNTFDQIYLRGFNESAGYVVEMYSSVDIDDTDWHHVMFSFDSSDTSKRHMYIDGADACCSSIPNYNTSDTIDFEDGAGTIVGVYQDRSTKLDGALADLWIDYNTYVDLSVQANREKFLNSDGNPEYLGPTGSYPTGSIPDIYLSGDTDSWHTNLTGKGGYTEVGALTDYETDPPEGTGCFTTSATGQASVESFTSNQTIAQTAAIDGTAGSYGTIIERASDDYGAEAGIGFQIQATPDGTDPSQAAITAVRSGSDGRAGLAFKTTNAAGEYGPRVFLDPQGDLGLGVSAPSDVGAKIQIRDYNGESWSGSYNRGLLVNSDAETTVSSGGTTTALNQALATGGFHSCAIKDDGDVYCWGRDVHGEVGNGTPQSSEVDPAAISESGPWEMVSSKDFTTCGLKTNGTAWCWGKDTNEQVGNGAGDSDQPDPVEVDGSATWTYIDAGYWSSCGIKSDYSLWCWGEDIHHQLGTTAYSDSEEAESPVEVDVTGPWESVSVGSSHACAIKDDGSLWCWGKDYYGAVGNDTDGSEEIPVQIDAGPWKTVSAGQWHVCGIKEDGDAYCWGRDGNGQLGNDTVTGDRLVPEIINESGPWASISAGWLHTCGVKVDGTGWCWGEDGNGQLGNGADGSQVSPDELSDVGPWSYIQAGQEHSCGVKTDGTVWCWGADGYGQLGNGADGAQTDPDEISDSGPWAIATTIGGSSGTASTTGLVGHWQFDESGNTTSAADSSISGYNGTLTNFAASPSASWITGVDGNALEFDGSNDHVDMGDVIDLSGQQSFTLSTWVYFNSDPLVNSYFLISKGYSYWLWWNGGNIYGMPDNSIIFGYRSTSPSDEEYSYAWTPSQDTWYHIAGVHDANNDTLTVYVNGVSLGTQSGYTIDILPDNNNVILGKAALSGDGPLDGALDDARIYDSALSASDVQQLYACTGGSGTCSSGIGGYSSLAYLGLEGSDDSASAMLYGLNLVFADIDTEATTVSEMMRLDADGLTTFSEQFLDVIDNDFSSESQSVTAEGSSSVVLQSSRGSQSARTNLQDGDILGALAFSGRNTSGSVPTEANAAIYGKVNGAPSVGNLPTELHFSTDTSGSAFSSSDMVLTTTGDLGIGTGTVAGKAQVAGRATFDEGLRIGDDSTCVDANDEGVLRVNSSALEYCDGAGNWVSLMGSGGGSTYSFVSLNDEGAKMAYVWGDNYKEQLSNFDNNADPANIPQGLGHFSGVEKAKAGYRVNCYLNYDGELFCWGLQNYYALGNNVNSGETGTPQEVVHPNGLRWTDFDIGKFFSCAIDSAKDAYCWGRGYAGMLGDGATSDNPTPNIVSGGYKWASISVGKQEHTCGVTTDGDGYCWGSAYYGYLGNGSSSATSSPSPVSGGYTWDHISAGATGSCGVTTDGDGYCWGNNDTGIVGNGEGTGTYNTPQKLYVGIEFDHISVDHDACGITKQNTMLCWGTLARYPDGSSGVVISERVWPTPLGVGEKWAQVETGGGTNCALTTDGKAWCWGEGSGRERGDNVLDDSATEPVEVATDLRFSYITSGAEGGLALTHPDYTKVSYAVGWGQDGNNQVGNDSATTNVSRPELVYHHYDWDMLAGGQTHSCGIVQNGDLYCWGLNNQGQLGDGTTTASDTPVQESDGLKWIHVTAAEGLTCGITVDRDGYCWGDDSASDGRLGDGGGGADSSNPELIDGAHKWLDIRAGDEIVCGVTVEGDGYCWGTEGNGELGNAGAGTTETVYSPTIVDGSYKWEKILPSKGVNRTTCGLTTTGAAYCWGSDAEGELGDGAGISSDAPNPVAVSGGFTFVDIGGSGARCGIDETGDAYCWGRGNNGEMGTGSTGDLFLPSTIVTGGYKWKKIHGGFKHVCGLTTTNDVYCWGQGGSAQIGDGNASASNATPSKVALGGTVSDMFVSWYGGFAIFSNDMDADPQTSECSPGQLQFDDLYTSTTSTDLTTHEIEVTGVRETCTLSVASESPAVTIYLNTAAQTGSSVEVENGDKVYLEIESPGTIGNSYTTYVSLGDTQTTQTTTTDEKIAFVYVASTGNTGGISGADSLCQTEAEAEGLSGTFLAWMGGQDGYPAARFSHWNYRYELTTGTKVADDWADLTDGLDNAINRNADGSATTAPYTYTNVILDGTPIYMTDANTCTQWTSTSPSSVRGNTSQVNSNWSAYSTVSCGSLNGIYCFEQ